MKKVILCLMSLTCLLAGTAVLAATGGGSSVSGNLEAFSGNLSGQMSAVAKLITAVAYVAGMAFAVAAIVKFKAHKDNPHQVPIGQPIAMLIIGAALLFLPSVIILLGNTFWGTDAFSQTASGQAGWKGQQSS